MRASINSDPIPQSPVDCVVLALGSASTLFDELSVLNRQFLLPGAPQRLPLKTDVAWSVQMKSEKNRKEAEERFALLDLSSDSDNGTDDDSSPPYTEKSNDETNKAGDTCTTASDSPLPDVWMLDMIIIPYGRSRVEKDAIRGDLRLTSRDLPTLMRNGLYWDENNVTSSQLRWEYLQASGWYWTQHIALRDLDHLDIPLWTADLYIFGCQGVVDHRVKDFKISDLSLNDVDCVVAGLKASHDRMYRYDRRKPQNNSNRIYPDRKLEGWWPWPRASLTALVRPGIPANTSTIE